jgi:hypothetical protein
MTWTVFLFTDSFCVSSATHGCSRTIVEHATKLLTADHSLKLRPAGFGLTRSPLFSLMHSAVRLGNDRAILHRGSHQKLLFLHGLC